MSIPLFNNPYLTVSVQVKTHRRSRINKKWLKRYGYKQVPDPNVYEVNSALYAHPETVKRIERALNRDNRITK